MAGESSNPPVTPSQSLKRKSNDYQKVLDDARAKLEPLGVPGYYFDVAHSLPFGYTDNILAGLLHVFDNVEDAGDLEEILYLGKTHRIFENIRKMKQEQFYRFLKFLKSEEGADALRQLNQKKKLEKRGGSIFTAQDIGWCAMFEAQRNDYITVQKDTKRGFDVKRAELEEQMRKLNQEEKQAYAKLNTEYVPYGEYRQMDNAEYAQKCWKEYLAHCRETGQKPVDLTVPHVNEAVTTFGDRVRQRHILEFLRDEEHKLALMEYVENKIGKFDRTLDERAAKRFRGLMAAVGLEVPPKASVTFEERTHVEDTNREPIAPNPDSVFDQALVDLDRPLGIGETGDRGEAETDLEQAAGDEPLPAGGTKFSPPATRSKALLKAGQKEHPTGTK